jgi:hypothetical protein
MARTNKISAVFAEADKNEVLTKIEELKTSMPFLISLTTDERKKLKGIGNKNLAYVQKCLEAALSFPDELKKNFDVDEFQKDVNLFNNLVRVHMICQSLTELVDDSMKAAGIDAMGSASEVYDALKSSAKSNANVKTVVNEIAERFKGQKGKSKNEPQVI